VLVLSLTAHFFVSPTLEFAEITFILSGDDDGQNIKECIYNTCWIFMCSSLLSVESFEPIRSEPESQGVLPSDRCDDMFFTDRVNR